MIALALGLLASAGVSSASAPDCKTLTELVRKVYTFRPSKLTAEEQKKRAAEMDRVWKLVRENSKELAPCLRSLLENPRSDAWFRVDGSDLLVAVEPTPESKKLQIACWGRADLKDLAPEVYVRKLTAFGFEGFDTTVAAEHWMKSPDASFDLAKHALHVGNQEGSIFLWGTIDETIATPALVKLLRDTDRDQREHAAFLLQAQATEEAWKELHDLKLGAWSSDTQKSVKEVLSKPRLEKKEASVLVTREKILAGFEAFLKDGKQDLLLETRMHQEKDDDWPARVAGVLAETDVPLLRKVRRKRLTYLSDEALYDFSDCTAILLTCTWKPEYAR